MKMEAPQFDIKELLPVGFTIIVLGIGLASFFTI